ncbi:MAG: methionyl-tRNA formyltransferase [Candidatus Omnitrophota bacterium]
MRFVYFGSSQFSKIILEELYSQSYVPVLIVSRPDQPKGRGLKLSATEVSQFAQDKKIQLIKPASLKGEAVKEILYKEDADFFIVVDYGEIIPESLLNLPKVLPLCIHPSLLPRYRGAAPIEETLINGEQESGVTIFKMNREVDAGDIILQQTLAVNYDDDFFSLSKRLAKNGVLLLIQAINKINNNTYSLRPQDDKLVTLTSKLKKEDGRIAWESRAQDIRNLTRATLGWPSAYSYYQDLMFKILKGDVIDQDSIDPPGTIVAITKEGISVACGKGVLQIKKVKPQGKSEMDAWSFACGYRIKNGERLK